jgi:hypothetical protein
MSLLRAIFVFACVFAAILSMHSGAVAEVPKYKPSSNSPAPLDITSNDYGYSRNAPEALSVGDSAPDFSAPRPGGAHVSLAAARQTGPVAIIFYRGHW